MKKVLPIDIQNNPIVSECWTFMRTAIIKTSPYAEDWLASHFQIYMDPSLCTYFGEGNDMYRPSYYEDILHVQNLDPFQMNADNIVSTIQNNIDNGRYIMCITNWNFSDLDKPQYHEVLIYGYDEEREVFFAPLMKKRIFVAAEIPFEHFRTYHASMLEDFKMDPNRRLKRSLIYQCPVISCRLREDYSPDQCVYMAMVKLDKEAWGRQNVSSLMGGDMQICDASTHYSGVACFRGLETILNALIQGRALPDHFIGLTNTLRKLYEHQSLVLLTMKYIQKKWRIEEPAVQEDVEAYAACCEYLQRWQYMSLKYEMTRDQQLLYRILVDVFHLYEKERMVLQGFQDAVFQWYEANSIA